MVLGSFVYAALTIDRGWIPHDDGMLGQAAVRVLTGELPHRDFQDVYTGALSYWHALSFVLFGIHLLAPRILLLLSFGAFLLVAYAVGRRFAGPRVSAAFVVLASIWSVPNYPAAMPSWYNGFLAVLGLWCFFRFLETDRRSWLFGAGAACGVSILVKVIGLYTLGAFLIGLAIVEAERAERDTKDPPHAGIAYRGVLVAGLCVYVLLVVWLVRARLAAETVAHFVAPSAAIAGVAIWRVARSAPGGSSRARASELIRLVAPLAAGVAVPVALFLVPYLSTGSVGDLVAGTLVLPFRRLEFAAASPLPLSLFVPALAPLALAAAAAFGRGAARHLAIGLLAVVLAVAVVLGGRDAVYRATWGGIVMTPVIVIFVALAAAALAWRRGDVSQRPLMTVLVAAVLATFTLIKYPFAGPIYSFYLAPLSALGAFAALAVAPAAWRASGIALCAFSLLFGARWVATASPLATAQGRYEPRPPLGRLDLERGRIRINLVEKAEYERLAGLLQELAGGSGVTFATPDVPEVYFLSGLRNPTPVFYDFLDEQEGRTARILATLEREDVRVIALSRVPQLSDLPSPELVAALEERYPRATTVGRFIVRWR